MSLLLEFPILALPAGLAVAGLGLLAILVTGDRGRK